MGTVRSQQLNCSAAIRRKEYSELLRKVDSSTYLDKINPHNKTSKRVYQCLFAAAIMLQDRKTQASY